MVEGRERFAAQMAGPAAGVGDAAPVPGDLPPGAPAREPRLTLHVVAAKARAGAGVLRDAVRRRRAATGAPAPPAILTDRRGLRFELQSAEEIEAFRLHGGHFESEEL